MPLYISLLYKVMKEAGTHEGTAEQIARLYRDHLTPGRTPAVDGAGRIRIDDCEMAAPIQARVSELWGQVTTDNLGALSDYAGFKRDFRRLFGFEVDGVDYAAPVETDVSLSRGSDAPLGFAHRDRSLPALRAAGHGNAQRGGRSAGGLLRQRPLPRARPGCPGRARATLPARLPGFPVAREVTRTTGGA